ncbi:hypothetical protein Tco_1425121, partial [Tanacetum coccineum]
VSFLTRAPVPDVRDLNFEYDVRTSDVTGSFSEEKDKSLSKADTYCEGLDKVELDSSSLPTWIRKLRNGGFKSGSFIHFKHLKRRNKFRYLNHIQRKDLKHNPSRLNLKWCRRAAFYEFIKEDSEYSNEDDDSQEDYGFDLNSRSQRRLSA